MVVYVCVCVCALLWYFFWFSRSHILQEPKVSSPWLRLRMCLETWVTRKEKTQKRHGIFSHQEREGAGWNGAGYRDHCWFPKGPAQWNPETMWEPQVVKWHWILQFLFSGPVQPTSADFGCCLAADRPWCWVRLKGGGGGDDRGWDGWMASLTQWTWVWVNSRSWWWTGKPGMLQTMGSQSLIRLSNWTELADRSSPFFLRVVLSWSPGISGTKVQNDNRCYFIWGYPPTLGLDYPHEICLVLLARGSFWKILLAQRQQSLHGSPVTLPLLVALPEAWQTPELTAGPAALMQTLPWQRPKGYFWGSPGICVLRAHVPAVEGPTFPRLQALLPSPVVLFFLANTLVCAFDLVALQWWVFLCRDLDICWCCQTDPTAPLQRVLFLFIQLAETPAGTGVPSPRLSRSLVSLQCLGFSGQAWETHGAHTPPHSHTPESTSQPR